MSGSVAAVLLSWNDAERVARLLERLLTLRPAPDRVLIVDNGSSDGTADRIAAACGECEVLRLDDNHGFAGAANRGIERAIGSGAEWVWLLNTDLTLPDDTLAKLATAAAADARCGMSAPVLVESDGNVQAWGGGRVSLWTGVSRHITSKDEQPHYLTGACLLMRASMLREIGLFDERYFFYWEDVDLGFRARRAEWSLAVAEDCRVEHHEGSTLGRWSAARWQYLFEGLRRFLRHHARLPRLALTLRLLHHSAAMARHGRWQALRGAWLGARSELTEGQHERWHR